FLYGEDGRRVRYPLEAETAAGANGFTLVRMKAATDPPIVWENPYRAYELPAGADDVARADQLFSIYPAVADVLPLQSAAETARRDQALLIALRESASTGNRPITLPLANVTAHEEQLHERYRETYGHDPLDISDTATRRLYPRRGVKQTIGTPQGSS